MHDLWNSLQLRDLLIYLQSGHPPIYIQLLIMNTLLMIVFIMRRVRGRDHPMRHINYTMQWFFIIASLLVLVQQTWLPYADEGKRTIVRQYEVVKNKY